MDPPASGEWLRAVGRRRRPRPAPSAEHRDVGGVRGGGAGTGRRVAARRRGADRRAPQVGLLRHAVPLVRRRRNRRERARRVGHRRPTGLHDRRRPLPRHAGGEPSLRAPDRRRRRRRARRGPLVGRASRPARRRARRPATPRRPTRGVRPRVRPPAWGQQPAAPGLAAAVESAPQRAVDPLPHALLRRLLSSRCGWRWRGSPAASARGGAPEHRVGITLRLRAELGGRFAPTGPAAAEEPTDSRPAGRAER